MKTMPEGTTESPVEVDEISIERADGRRVEMAGAERSHVTLVAGDPPMIRLEIKLYSWERGDSEIEVTLPHGGELSDLLQWALPEQRLVICGNLRARIQDELNEVFELLQDR